MMTIKIAPYGTWETTLRPADLFQRPSPPSHPSWHGGVLYWLETRTHEAGRVVLMRRDGQGDETCLTPEGFSIRSRVHEYGGKCFVLDDGRVYFSNDGDQRLYVQSLTAGAAPVPLTKEPDTRSCRYMYADLQLTADGRMLVFVLEQEYRDRENRNRLGALPLGDGAGAGVPAEPLALASGADFYANPVVSPDGTKLAWVQWNHPHMPWDETTLLQGDLDGTRLRNIRTIAGGAGRSVNQLGYHIDGSLVFTMDRDDGAPADGFWNLYRWRDGEVERITEEAAEYGAAHWVFGDCRHVPLGPDEQLAVRTRLNGDDLVVVDIRHHRTITVPGEYRSYAQISRIPGDGALLIGTTALSPPAILRFDARARRARPIRETPSPVSINDTSVAEALSYPTSDGASAHAYFYPPRNARYRAPPDGLPPVVVMVHGGPTSRTAPSFDLAKQYWTNLGFAVLDVNHRGSTGYGRRYRQSLLGHWGEFDVRDVVDGVTHLAALGRIDPDKVCIRGRSAGGYVVLRALTVYPDRFRAGACYFGIGNLATLAEMTHKFEKHYIDNLVGEGYDPERARDPSSAYRLRSPIHYLDRIRSPVIIFQGAEDKVVPPELSREIVAALRKKGIEHEYREYGEEGHGFRRCETNVDALERETAFYRRALGLNPSAK